MRKESPRSSRHGGENIRPEKQSRREEGSSWASTPETRAQEGVFASYQESQKTMRGQEAASHVIEDAPSPSHADSPSIAHQSIDAHVPYIAPFASSELTAPSTSFITASSSDALVTHSVSEPVPNVASTEPIAPDAHPATYVSAPVPVTPPASNSQPYDYYSGDRYDIYGYHQYDDYYLWDDFFLWDEFYGHDDYNPHLYYDIGTYPDAQSTHSSESYYFDQPHSYDSSAYRYHETRWSDEARATEPFVSSAATAAGVILAGERVQEASAATGEPANQAFETLAQAAYTSDVLEGHSSPHLQSESSPLPDFAQAYQVTHTQQATVSSLMNDRQAEALFPQDSYGTPASSSNVNGIVPSPDYPFASTLFYVVPEKQYPAQVSHTSSQVADILPSAEVATVQHAINQHFITDGTLQPSGFEQHPPFVQPQEASTSSFVSDRQTASLLHDASTQAVSQSMDPLNGAEVSHALLENSAASLTPTAETSASEAYLSHVAQVSSAESASLLHPETPLSQSLVFESSLSSHEQAASGQQAPFLYAPEDENLLRDSMLYQLQNQSYRVSSLEHAPAQEVSTSSLVDDRQAASLLQDAANQAAPRSMVSPQGEAVSHALLGSSAASFTPTVEENVSEAYLSQAAQAVSEQQAPFLHAPETECLVSDNVLHQLQNQPYAACSIEHATTQETPRTATAALKGNPSSPIQSNESATSRLTVNRLDEVRDDLQFINSRNIEIQPESLDSVLTGGVAYSALHATESQPLGTSSLTTSSLLALQNRTDEARGVESNDLGGLLVNPDARLGQSKEFLVAPIEDAKPTDTRDSLFSESSAATLVSNHSEAKGSRSQPFETHGSESKGSEAKARKGKDTDTASAASDAVTSTSSKEALVAKEAGDGTTAFGSTAHIAALGTLGFAGKVAKAGTEKTLGVLDYAANQLLREDEDLTRVADLDDIVHDGVAFMRRHASASDSESMIDRLISNERSVEDALAGNSGTHARDHVKEAGRAVDDADKITAGKHARKPTEAAAKAKTAGVREIPEAVSAGELFAVTKSSGITSSKADLLEKGPTGLKAVAMKASDQHGVERHLLEKGENKDPLGKKKPTTERERAIEKKKADRKAARKEKNDSKAMSVVKSSGSAGMKGALLIGGMAESSTKKALASRNEEIAVAMSTADKTKKTVKGAKTLVKLPFRIYHRTRQVITAAINTIKHLFSFAATLTSMGPVGAVIALALFFLIIVVIVILFATASIINDEQEVSEVSALVAELDADLTEEIHEMGDQPILYLDASETYNQKGSKNQSLTKDADLADDESDLQEVVASSVTVQTDPGAIAAYIDAKYTGNWQVGAASWKYTIDAFGETWNVIEWDDMPEWAWKALNKVNRVDFKITLRNELTDLLMEDFSVDEPIAREIGSDTAEEFATVIYDNQIQGINEEVLMQIIKDSVKAHKSDLELTNDELRKLYYQMQNVIADLIGEEDPFAFVYDEIVGLHAQMNWWSDRYDVFTDLVTILEGPSIPVGSGSGTDNKYGYPNSTGYDEEELANWDGFNEVSVYGISEAGTGAVTADGTRITNTWSDANMGIACEGLQNSIFAYWSSDYKASTGVPNGEPVKITLYNPLTGKSVTAQVIDCGGWRGYNANYAGMNADRQWDLLPAVWKALGGSESAGTMVVYWKVDPEAVVGEPALKKKSIEGYLWPKEIDEGDDVITITRPTLIVHDIQDALNNDTLMEKIIDKESFATAAEFEAVKTFVVTKVKDVMKTLLTMENLEGDTYVDYNYVRRNLGDPFGDNDQGNPREWVVTHRFNPGYEDFDDEKAYVEIRPLDDMRTVRAVLEGEVKEIDGGVVTIRSYIDTANSSEIVYSELTDIRVEEGDEVKEGQKIGAMANETLRLSYYEINDTALLMETKKDWAYDPGLYMIGFAGYEEPAEPVEYVGPTSDYSGCQTVVEFAYSRLGCPYVWGATGPSTFDCSGLTQWCYAQAGITIPRNSEAQHDAAAAAGNLVSLSNLQPGDILWRPGHVGIYVGDGKYIHAPHTGDVVKVSGDIFSFQVGLRFS